MIFSSISIVFKSFPVSREINRLTAMQSMSQPRLEYTVHRRVASGAEQLIRFSSKTEATHFFTSTEKSNWWIETISCLLCRNIFCDGGPGSILHTVQLAKIFPDSKTFVDMKMRHDPATVKQNFESMMKRNSLSPERKEVEEFVSENFTEDCSLEPWQPSDWKPRPSFAVKRDDYRDFCHKLNDRWKMLGRRVDGEVAGNQDRHSLLHLPNPVVVPGGRFREIYYWDSFWILRGLLACRMVDTARGMIENLVHLIDTLGFVPNGGRVYYTRSQPPLLAAMVESYVKATGDLVWGRRQLKALESEWEYWQRHHSVDVAGHTLFRYSCSEGAPRPESYREDWALAEGLDQQKKEDLWRELRSAAESGWDFSSRWFMRGSTLAATSISDIVPVDLNSFLCKAAAVIGELHKEGENEVEAGKWEEKSWRLCRAMEELLWSEEDGCWFDLSLSTGCKNARYAASNLTPLWAMPEKLPNDRATRGLAYMRGQGALNYPGGIPTTLNNSGQQWDFPNVWPPLEHMIIVGMHSSPDSKVQEEALCLARRRVDHCLKVFLEQGHMYEKYNCEDMSKAGGGGEYEVQLGFGWTNGMLLDLMTTLDL